MKPEIKDDNKKSEPSFFMHFYFDQHDNTKQDAQKQRQNQKPTSLLTHSASPKCPLCYTRIELFDSMLCHLNQCHARLKFELDTCETVSAMFNVISVRLRSEYDEDDWSYEAGSEHQLNETAHLGFPASRLRASIRPARDLYVMFVSPVVKVLRRTFAENWDFQGLDRFDEHRERIFYHSKTTRSNIIYLALFM